MKPVLVILAVGLSPELVGEHTPNLRKLVARGGLRALDTVTPAVTCSVQSTLLTGLMPQDHGIVGNGWYFRDLAEVGFWKQSNHLVSGEKLWEAGRARNPEFTTAKMFWWYNMYASADWSATPRPQYPADGRKIPDHYSYPAGLHDELDKRFGQFPLFSFWGPKADITSSDWIARATLHVMEDKKPTLTLTYLPHLDYNLQRLGPDLTHPRLQKDLTELDDLCGALIEAADAHGMDTLVVSEYGITEVNEAVHINRALREAGLLAVRSESGREQLDAGASVAFAVSDHQLAHIYVQDPQRVSEVASLINALEGVESVLSGEELKAIGLSHSRAGELVAITQANRWFSYYFWLDDDKAPDYSRTVDIHRKPGYDPVELFVDPKIQFPMAKIAGRLAQRKLGMRALLDVISPNATSLVKGSHGRPTDDPKAGPLVISSRAECLPEGAVHATQFKNLVLAHVFGEERSALVDKINSYAA
ncbi:MAG: alkaline phosphatase family protein [Gammaproteobacteria bacterium]|nr:alkaline phosphatase family protein [Gammaproteobacteria bacterium]